VQLATVLIGKLGPLDPNTVEAECMLGSLTKIARYVSRLRKALVRGDFIDLNYEKPASRVSINLPNHTIEPAEYVHIGLRDVEK
jgi:hypothetical protein